MKISYNRNSMLCAIIFLRTFNPYAAAKSELDLLQLIESFMSECANDPKCDSMGTLGVTVIKNHMFSDDTEVGFHIVVDPGVAEPYDEVTVNVAS